MIDQKEIKANLPHHPPALLLDSAEILNPGSSATSITDLKNHPHIFDGHFPGNPIMPGVLLVECIAQTAALMFSQNVKPTAKVKTSSKSYSEKACADSHSKYLVRISNANFKRPVLPGQTLNTTVSLLKQFGSLIKIHGTILVEHMLVAEATLIVQDNAPRVS